MITFALAPTWLQSDMVIPFSCPPPESRLHDIQPSPDFANRGDKPIGPIGFSKLKAGTQLRAATTLQ